ncbi:MAG: N-6 DNA methylase [Ignavibacteriales bacterium]|nr:N-6 DNA methylase [Ignavibacteriales bacterium]
MLTHSIQRYYQEVEKLKHRGGTKMESTVSQAFYTLLNDYAQQKELMLVPQVWVKGKLGRKVKPDGTLKDSLRQDWGFWESKDEADDIDEEIEKKFAKGYPDVNILFEDSNTAILIQSGLEVMRVSFSDADKLDEILKAFVSYERPEVETFRKAIELFKEDVPNVTETLRNTMSQAEKHNKFYVEARDEFFDLCKEAINPQITLSDITEMMIQHILTADIFNTVFDEPYFHRENNVAKALEKVVDTFFVAEVRKKTLNRIQHYYQAINAAAAGIADHHEKQKFLKAVYETFYKSYNPKAADRLGVVYTPNEIVRFMVESTDYLLHKHFGKFLEDKDVEILDPATGTGTFICDIIDHIRTDKLEYKYKNELHANEVAILPYYIANLNIEFTYKQKMEQYAEFQNLCFVDTLDNMGFGYRNKQEGLFAVSAENVERIRRQNKKKISVIIGNPPYNAWQANYNDQNANRGYKEIDTRIKNTFVKYGTAQNQIGAYDMYTRFFRWAMDRLNENGIIALITNRSYIDSRALDGFRKCIQDDFDYAYIIDTKSDVRQNPKIAGTTHNVFGIQTGVAVILLVKKAERENAKCLLRYIAMDDYWRKEEKLGWFTSNQIKSIPFETLIPDKKYNWINLSDNDFDDLLPLVDKDVKAGKGNNALFKLFSSGLKTQRDEWMYDVSEESLEKKVKYFVKTYEQTRTENSFKGKMKIKWDEDLESYLQRKIKKKYSSKSIVSSLYRPFTKFYLYFDKHFNGRTYQWFDMWNEKEKNLFIAVPGIGSNKSFQCLANNTIIGLDTLEKTQCLPLYRFTDDGTRVENITDWGLEQFRKRYSHPERSEGSATKGKKKDSSVVSLPQNDKAITKEDIFHYVYAVLHNPAYRKKYEINLKREFPRIPLYDDFWKWSAWGKQLMDLHVNYEKAKPYALSLSFPNASIGNPERGKKLDPRLKRAGMTNRKLKPKLKADKDTGTIIIDDETTLTGIPKEAWEYKLGNRSALEWVLDQYKESTPSDPTIAEKFNRYKFADYKKEVIELLKKVCTVSVETMKIVGQMAKLKFMRDNV